MDFRKYARLESYLLDEVRPRFLEQQYLSAFDFFCIVIWKANRSKSKIAKMLLKCSEVEDLNLDQVVAVITRGLVTQDNGKERLRALRKLGFQLPMASAILTILYPDEFTVYDTRVCDQIGGFDKLKHCRSFEKLWSGYQEYRSKVEGSTPVGLSLRDKDRYLWGKSFYEQLTKDIESGFKHTERFRVGADEE